MITNSPNINHLWARLIIDELIRNGIDQFFIAPGSRSTPLTAAVAEHSKAKSIIHFDERALGFAALGFASGSSKPCAVITTSGTAVANLFPSIVEASKKKLPLIILTADRPPELRGTGANQTIDQVKIFGDYVRWFFDFPTPTLDISPEFILTSIDQAVFKSKGELKGPIHINCMFRDPLIPKRTHKSFQAYLKPIVPWLRSEEVFTQYSSTNKTLHQKTVKEIAQTIHSINKGIIVVGKLMDNRERTEVLALSEKLNWPIFPDISSGLRLGYAHKNLIHYFDQILAKKNLTIDGILHLGGRLTSNRYYEHIKAAKPKKYIMVINHPLRNDPTHCVSARVQISVGQFCRKLSNVIIKKRMTNFLQSWQKANQLMHQKIEKAFYAQAHLTEFQLARVISQNISKDNALFVSSSMPIRDLDMFGDPHGASVLIGSNRGASGIDGTIASAIGFSGGCNKPVTLLTGDLAALYDMNALAMLKSNSHPIIIVIINNNGGGIFSYLPIAKYDKIFRKYFQTPHDYNFSSLAEMFECNYAQPASIEEFQQTYSLALKSQFSSIIEVTIDNKYGVNLQKLVHTSKNKQYR